MKNNINHIFITFLFAFLCFTSCQDEISQIENPNEQETIVPNSVLADLMALTSANSGIADDILDGASCFSVELPVTIVVSDVTIVIETEADLEQLEDLLDDVNINDDVLDFVFPITIIFSDYSQIVIANEDQLQTFIDECFENEDDVIECVDFVYPISFSVFNSTFNLVDTVVIENDEALYVFLNELEDDENALIVSLNFPITLVYANGETIEINSNEELANAIEVAEQFCEDENDDCLEDDVSLTLVECPWDVYLYSNNDIDTLDGPYIFTFSENGSLIIEGITDQPHSTTWELLETDEGLELNIASFYYFEAQFGNWLVVECDDDELKFIHQTVEGTGLYFEQNCDDDLDCSLTDLSAILQECPWAFSDGTGNFANHRMIFNPNSDLQISEGIATSAIGGNWSLSSSDNGIVLNFSELTAFQNDLSGDWLIVECDDDRILLHKGNQTLVLEQDCEGDLGCSAEDINANIIECAWELQTNLIDSFVPIYVYFSPNGQVLSGNFDGTENQIGIWSLVAIASNLYIDFTFQQGFEVLNGQWQVVECSEGELYLVSGNNYIALDQDCDIGIDDEVFNCFDDFEIIECSQPNNVPIYNLSANTIGLVNCTESFIPSFHPTLMDAQNNTNAIANTEAYGTLTAIVYLRIEANSGNFEVFNIYLNSEDCTNYDCFENTQITACDDDNDGFATFNLTEANQECGPDIAIYGIYYFETEIDAQSIVNPISNPESYTNTANPTTIFGAVINVTSNSVEHIFTIDLILEDCGQLGCFESIEPVIEVCDNGTDGPYEFNLPLLYVNCNADEIRFYLSIANAETDTNMILNPSSYSTADINSVVYVRADFNGQTIIGPVSLNVIECNSGNCTEGDIDGILTECIWNVVNYNGSDNLMEYNFAFEANSQIVVIYTDSLVIDATWSTSQSNNGVVITFSNVAGPNIQAITGEWLVVECENDRLELHRGNDIMVLERTCE